MAPKNPQEILPYHDSTTGTLKYAPNPNSNLNDDISVADQPLITPSERLGVSASDDAGQRFTATGRPMPQFKQSGLLSLGADMCSAPTQFLPTKYTDESIIPGIVVDYEVSGGNDEEKSKSKRSSFLSRLKGEPLPSKNSKPTKVVYMPRGEYLKHFARDSNGEYSGTEPFKRWTEVELEETYGKYRPATSGKNAGRR
ncbi:hypothetical protein B7463_g6274, partial [Scytalidium lignicola]